MAAKFLSTVLHGSGWTYIRLAGVIDEENRLNELVGEVRGQLLLLDLGGIERINSCGVRDWINWLGQLKKIGCDTRLLECSPAIVAQLNLVKNFTGAASVVSIGTPYYCESCELEQCKVTEVIDMAGNRPQVAPVYKCPQCRVPMAFDDIEESYFGFLTSVKSSAIDTAVASALQRTQDMLGNTPRPVSLKAPSPLLTTSESQRHPMAGQPIEIATKNTANSSAEGPMSPSDIAFYVVVGVLLGLFTLVLYNIVVG